MFNPKNVPTPISYTLRKDRLDKAQSIQSKLKHVCEGTLWYEKFGISMDTRTKEKVLVPWFVIAPTRQPQRRVALLESAFNLLENE